MERRLTDSLKRLVRVIKGSKKILIATHIDPDCDGICSALAMARFVNFYRKIKPKLFCYSAVPEKYQFLLKGYQFRKTFEDFDLLITVDSADIDRIFPKKRYNLNSLAEKLVINIDHHSSNNQFGDIRIIDEKASSACEIIYRMFLKLKFKIDVSLAEILYAGIYNETGGFIYPNTTANAMKACSDLITRGVDPAKLVKNLNAKTEAGTKLLSSVLKTIKIKDGMGVMYMTQKMLKENRAQMSESENFISFLQAIKDVRISVFFREEDEETRISLRSDGLIDVNRFAKKFGGGGHQLAAGIRLKENLKSAKEKILNALIEEIRDANNLR